MNRLLTGDIYITNNMQYVLSMLEVSTMKIVSLDESGTLSLDHPNVIGGTILLPGVDTCIAKVDGEEELFNMFYYDEFNSPGIQEFVSMLIAYLFKGGGLLLYYPEWDKDVVCKLLEIFWNLFGIGIGVISESNCTYNEQFRSKWLINMYLNRRIIDWRTLLMYYPTNENIPIWISDQILMDFPLYGESLEDKHGYIESLKFKFKEKPNLRIPIIAFG